MIYQADIGSWEQGRMVDINAKNPREALKFAAKQCDGTEEVVQIREKKSRKCKYDYWNGFSIYNR